MRPGLDAEAGRSPAQGFRRTSFLLPWSRSSVELALSYESGHPVKLFSLGKPRCARHGVEKPGWGRLRLLLYSTPPHPVPLFREIKYKGGHHGKGFHHLCWNNWHRALAKSGWRRDVATCV